uniref:olfactory receptor 5AC2-like n=1 Tax=Myxine glutinosa TaxID=7769 RepID=UPI0035902602
MAKVSEPWSARQQRHLSAVSEFMTDIRHVAGKDNAVAGCLSRSVAGAVHLCVDYARMVADQVSDPMVQALRTADTGLRLSDVPFKDRGTGLMEDIMFEGNQSLPPNVFLLTPIFHEQSSIRPWAFGVLFVIFLVTITLNLILILIILCDKKLHKPVYIFLAHLLIMDIVGCTTITPRLMYSISQSIMITKPACFIQLFFVSFTGAMQSYILSIMAIDRYLAVCHPLRYNVLLTNSRAHKVILLTVCWSSLIIGIYVVLLIGRTFCKYPEIHKVGCVHMAVAKLSCEDFTINSLYGIACSSLTTVTLIVVVVVTYTRILYVCQHSGPSSKGNRKALHTCVTHCLVLSLYIFSNVFVLISLRMSSTNYFPQYLQHVSDSLFYLVQPLANPIIYGVRTAEIRRSLTRFTNVRIFQNKIISWHRYPDPQSSVLKQLNCVSDE